jgi:hypothetical protein
MAIERKDRSFDKIFEEVSFERVPMDYVMSIKIYLLDGSVVELDREQLENVTDEAELLADISRENVSDISITLDYDSIKEDVGSTVKDVLGKMFKETDE